MLQANYGQEAVAATIVSNEEGDDRNPKSCLHLSALRGKAALLRVLLEARADPQAQDDAGNTALHFATDRGHARAAHVLLKGGASKDVENNFCKSPAKNAEEQTWDTPDVKAGKELVRRMFAGSFPDYESLPPEPARRSSSASSTSDGYGGGASSGSGGSNGAIGCEGAAPTAAQGMARFAALMADAKTGGDSPDRGVQRVDVDLVPRADSHYAASEVSTALLVGDLDVETGKYVTFSDVVRRGDLAAVRYHLGEIRARAGSEGLVATVTNTEEDDKDTRVVMSPLHIAARLGHAEVLEALLATRSDPNLTTDAGDTLLHYAASAGREEAVQVLLAAGADIDLKNNFGRSAAEMSHPESWESQAIRTSKQRLSRVLSTALEVDDED